MELDQFQKEMMRKAIEFETGLHLVFRLWESNKVPSAIAALKKMQELKNEMIDMLKENMPLPTEDQSKELVRQAFSRFGYNYDEGKNE